MPINAVPGKKVSLASAGAVLGGVPFLHIEPQCRAHWCWAAVCVSIGRRYGIAWDQAHFAHRVLQDAGKEFPDEECFGQPCDASSTLCSVPSFGLPLDQIPIEAVKSGGPLPRDLLIHEMEAGRPVGVKINWTSASKLAGGHYIAIVGMTQFGGTVLFHPGDPMDLSVQAMPYESLVRYQGDGSWAASWRMAS